MNRLQLEQIIAEHGDGIYSFFLHLTGDIAEADDLYQDSFLKAIELDELDFAVNPKSYIIGIGINLHRNRKRKEFFRRKKVSFDLISEVEQFFSVPDNNDTVELIEQRDINRIVRQNVYKLNDKLKEVVLLFYMQNMTTKEIAVLLNIPEGTVKTRLFKARKLLKEQLEDLL